MNRPGARYDEIGRSYGHARREDPRVAAAIHDALGAGRSLVNVGAGSGSYSDHEVQAGMSWLALLPAEVRERGSARLRDDLSTGQWDERHGHLRSQSTYDGGYRLAIAG